MRKTEIIFLACVLVCGGLFAARSLSLSGALLWGSSPTGSAVAGVAGQSRQVDMTKLQRLLDRGDLSDHEAECYGPFGTPPSPGDDEDETGDSPSADHQPQATSPPSR